MRTLLYAAGCLALSVSIAHGATILDDFHDPAQVTLPEVENELVVTNGVGQLNATRSIQITSLSTDPIGFSDVNLSKHSTWTTRIDQQTNMGSNPGLSFFARYDFDQPVDLTEGGQNDAVLIDFRRFVGPSSALGPWFVSVGVLDGNNTYLANHGGGGILQDSPFTVAFPFTSLGTRGGGGGQADFQQIDRLALTIGLINGNRNPVQGWHVEIDSIRVGRIIAEPSTVGMAAIVLVGAVWRSRVTRLSNNGRGRDECSLSLADSLRIDRC